MTFVATSAFAVACDDSSATQNPTEIEQVYAQYVVHAQAEGLEPLSYEDWLATIKGEKGDKGDQGIQGDKGDKGDTGATGLKGDKGDTGEQGADGKSAYQIWLEQGNEGTEEDFLNWLKGDVHSFGDWVLFSSETTPCEDRLYFRVCSTCKDVEWKQGSEIDHVFNDWNECSVCEKIIATEGVLYRISEDETYAEVIGYEGTATKVRIADAYNGLPVKNIVANAFYNKYKIVSVIIPNSVTSIGYAAFADCDNLTSVVIGDSVEIIDAAAFSYCRSLTSVVIPDSVTTIGSYAFSDCGQLTSVVVGDGVTTICQAAFESCYSLTSLVIGNGVTTIAAELFGVCRSLTNITVSEGNSVYKDIDGNLYSKDGKTLIQYAIGKSATEFIIPNTVTAIGAYAFEDCTSLTRLVIGDGVTTIGSAAFYNCSSLTSIVIPDSVTSIAFLAFDDCDSLASVYYKGTAVEWAEISMGLSNESLTNATRYYYSEEEPTEEGNYWHYDTDGVTPIVWTKEE